MLLQETERERERERKKVQYCCEARFNRLHLFTSLQFHFHPLSFFVSHSHFFSLSLSLDLLLHQSNTLPLFYSFSFSLTHDESLRPDSIHVFFASECKNSRHLCLETIAFLPSFFVCLSETRGRKRIAPL